MGIANHTGRGGTRTAMLSLSGAVKRRRISSVFSKLIVLAFVAFMRGLGLLGPVRTAIVSTVEPFFTAVLGAAVLAQPAGPATFVGGTLIAAAVLLVQRPPRPASGLHRGAAEHDTSASASHEVHV